MKVPAAEDDVRLMTKTGSIKLPGWAVNLSPMHNHGNFIVSLGQLTPWLAQQAEKLGVDIFPGFAAAEALFDEQGAVKGVRIGDMGLEQGRHARARTTRPASRSTPARRCSPKAARGSISQAADREVQPARGRRSADVRPRLQGALAAAARPRASPAASSTRSAGRSTPSTYGGSFLYHLDKDRVYVGYVVGLNYEDPRLKPFEAFQQFKNHPRIKPLLEGGEILAAGARTIVAGGYQSLPKLEMPGAMLIGDAGGTLNVFKIKGIHQAIRSGVLAAEHLAEAGKSAGFDARWRASEGHRELRAVRNFKPAFKRGLYFAMFNAGIEIAAEGHVALDDAATRPTGRRWKSSTSTPRPIAAGSIARCRRATGSPRCSSPATCTTNRSRCT